MRPESNRGAIDPQSEYGNNNRRSTRLLRYDFVNTSTSDRESGPVAWAVSQVILMGEPRNLERNEFKLSAAVDHVTVFPFRAIGIKLRGHVVYG
jgi:hypothetical protein